jgi:hypothetical protein
VPYRELGDGRKLTRASVGQRAEGAIVGVAEAEWLISRAEGGSAEFVGHQQVTGTLNELTGSFILEHVGSFRGELVHGTVRVVPGSGTDELAGLLGQGTFESPRGPNATIALDYQLERTPADAVDGQGS